MKNKWVAMVERDQLRDDIPDFRAGDIISIGVRIDEGGRSRVQQYEGTVIARKRRGIHEAALVRKISGGVAVERTFQLHSPAITAIQVKRRGKVRQARIYYLRERTGRKARIAERID